MRFSKGLNLGCGREMSCLSNWKGGVPFTEMGTPQVEQFGGRRLKWTVRVRHPNGDVYETGERSELKI